MEFAETPLSGTPHPSRAASVSPLRETVRDAALVLQVDGTVSAIDGLAWLAARRDEETAQRLNALQLQAVAERWNRDDFARARLAILRPRRSEISALGKAYLQALTPGAIEAAHRLRRAGIAVELSGEVAVEALLGVAGALGITPDAIHAPRLRFDALGAYLGCEPGEREGNRPARVHVGTRTAEQLAGAADHFVRFTGVVAYEGPGRGDSVGTFAELAELLAP